MLLREVEKFLRRTGMPATKFGRLAVSDPRLVLDLRNGREPRRRMMMRVEHFMNNHTPSFCQLTQESPDAC
ncbi:hypothetical protein EKN06_13270 [Croceicoccus ponticola]|uniref:Transcriptional regulator n=1 Tax=Croceicoccus ponticola TaxID=2217664 RepID=A0A437GVG8_9SPHN|nr:hypothetical protein [Croceicoccus ponticola]RVQ65499.1 hypothetical protein EKN06_13270 [Croceicoccus ponticola]